jgi:hypothetical protein
VDLRVGLQHDSLMQPFRGPASVDALARGDPGSTVGAGVYIEPDDVVHANAGTAARASAVSAIHSEPAPPWITSVEAVTAAARWVGNEEPPMIVAS